LVYILYTIHIVVSLFLILVVLLQQGKGADLSVFGGGGTQAAFGARGAATLLHKLTVGAFVAFILTTILIGFASGGGGSSSVMSSVPTEEAVAEESAPAPEDLGVADSVAADPATELSDVPSDSEAPDAAEPVGSDESEQPAPAESENG
jgi:preprotein translocase subunit SecG